jgi:hypothetical protein
VSSRQSNSHSAPWLTNMCSRGCRDGHILSCAVEKHPAQGYSGEPHRYGLRHDLHFDEQG